MNAGLVDEVNNLIQENESLKKQISELTTERDNARGLLGKAELELAELKSDAFKAGELKGRKAGLEESIEILYKEKRKLENHRYYNAVRVVEDFIFEIRQHAASLGGGE